VIEPLAFAIARRGRWFLVAGLVLGLASPTLAHAMRPTVGPLVVALLFLAMLRIGPEGFRVGRAALSRALGLLCVLQLALPLAVALGLSWAGLLDRQVATGAVLIMAAAPITGAAHIVVMTGGEPALALRQTVIGTALLPLTVLPVFALVPAFGSAAEIAGAVLRLLAIILCAGGLACCCGSAGWCAIRPGREA